VSYRRYPPRAGYRTLVVDCLIVVVALLLLLRTLL